MSFLPNVPRVFTRLPPEIKKQNQVSHRQIIDGPSNPGCSDDTKYMSVTFLPYPDFNWDQKSATSYNNFNILCKDHIGELVKINSRCTIRKVHSEASVKHKVEDETNISYIQAADGIEDIYTTKTSKSSENVYAVYPLSLPEGMDFVSDNISPEKMPAVEELIRTVNGIKAVDYIKLSLALRERERATRGSARIVLPELDHTFKILLSGIKNRSTKRLQKSGSHRRLSAFIPGNHTKK